MTKALLILHITFGGLCFQVQSCGNYNEQPMMKLMGPDDLNDLVFFYKKNATYEQKEFFQNTVIHKPHPGVGGYDLQVGVIDLLYIQSSGYNTTAIRSGLRFCDFHLMIFKCNYGAGRILDYHSPTRLAENRRNAGVSPISPSR